MKALAGCRIPNPDRSIFVRRRKAPTIRKPKRLRRSRGMSSEHVNDSIGAYVPDESRARFLARFAATERQARPVRAEVQ